MFAALIAGCAVHSVPVGEKIESRLKANAVSASRIGISFQDGGKRYEMQVFTADLDPAPVVIPMERSYGGLPALRVKFNAAPALRMIADTGAQLCVVEPRHALAADAAVYASENMPIRITGIGGEERAWLARFDHAQIGPMTLHGLVSILRREKTQLNLGGIPLAGYEVNLLGCPVISGFRYVTFDFPARRFVFSPATPFNPGRDAIRIPMTVRENLIYVPLRIGKHRAQAMVDTGAKDEIFLNEKTVRAWGLERRAAVGGSYRAAGLGGMTHGRSFEMPLAFLGALPLRGATIDTAPGPWDARIGTDLLRKWRVTFDFGAGAMWLEPG